MAKLSEAAAFLFIACALLLLEEIDAMSLRYHSPTPQAVSEESDSSGEEPFSPVLVRDSDWAKTKIPSENTTTPSETSIVPYIITEQAAAENTLEFLETTTTPTFTAEPPSETTTPSVTTTPSEITPTTTPSFTTGTLDETTIPSVTTTPSEITPTTTPSFTTGTPDETTTPPVATIPFETIPGTPSSTDQVTETETTPVWTWPLTTSPCGGPDDCPDIVNRADWGAKAAKAVTAIRHPIPKVFIHHTDGMSCTTQANCSRIVKGIQDFHQNERGRGWADIAYNFLVGEDGNAYEGRGWDSQGAHAKKWNPVSLGIAVIGSFMKRAPNAAALDTVQKLIACGVCKGKIAGNYTLHGHKDGCPTDCPGAVLYKIIQKWPHYGGFLGGKC